MASKSKQRKAQREIESLIKKQANTPKGELIWNRLQSDIDRKKNEIERMK